MKGKWFRRVLAGAVSAAMCCTMLAGCFGGGDLPETDAVQIYNPMADAPFFRYLEAWYPKNYPEVAFNYDTSKKEYTYMYIYGSNATPEALEELQSRYDSMSLDIMKGECGDLIFADTFYQWFDSMTPPDYMKMVKAGAFTDLKPLLAEYAPDFDLSVYDDLLVDDKLYMIPVQREPYRIYGMENLLAEWDFDCSTEEDALSFLRRCAVWQEEHVSDADAPKVFSKEAWNYIYMNIFNILGLDVVDYQNGTANFAQPEVLEALELLKALKSDYSEPRLGEEKTLSDVYGYFLFGRSDGMYDSSTRVAKGLDMPDKTVYMPLLQMDGKAATSAQTYMMIPSTAKNIRNAAKYIALYLDTMTARHTSSGKDLPECGNRIFAWDCGDEAFETSFARTNEVAYTTPDFADVVKKNYQNQGHICMPSCWYYSLQNLFDDYMAGKISIDTLASDVQSRLEIYVTE